MTDPAFATVIPMRLETSVFTVVFLCACASDEAARSGTEAAMHLRTHDQLMRLAAEAVERAGVSVDKYALAVEPGRERWHDAIVYGWDMIRANATAVQLIADGCYDVVWGTARQPAPYTSNLFDEMVVLIDRAAESRCAVIEFPVHEVEVPWTR